MGTPTLDPLSVAESGRLTQESAFTGKPQAAQRSLDWSCQIGLLPTVISMPKVMPPVG